MNARIATTIPGHVPDQCEYCDGRKVVADGSGNPVHCAQCQAVDYCNGPMPKRLPPRFVSSRESQVAKPDVYTESQARGIAQRLANKPAEVVLETLLREQVIRVPSLEE